jgi:hypothetical protein
MKRKASPVQPRQSRGSYAGIDVLDSDLIGIELNTRKTT